MLKKISVSIVMPALNEAKNIRNAIDNVFASLSTLQIEGEVIVINDGSTDATLEIISEEIKKHPGKIKVITHTKPAGIGASFWDGISQASKEAVVLLPGDAENDAMEILRYLDLLNHVDIVIPYVFNKGIRRPSRNLLSAIFIKIINITFKMNLRYTNGTIIYRRNILKNLTHYETGFFFQVEILAKLIQTGYLFAEVPYKLDKRKSGDSKAVSFKSFRNVAKGYIRLFIKQNSLFTKQDNLTLTPDSKTLERSKL